MPQNVLPIGISIFLQLPKFWTSTQPPATAITPSQHASTCKRWYDSRKHIHGYTRFLKRDITLWRSLRTILPLYGLIFVLNNHWCALSNLREFWLKVEACPKTFGTSGFWVWAAQQKYIELSQRSRVHKGINRTAHRTWHFAKETGFRWLSKAVWLAKAKTPFPNHKCKLAFFIYMTGLHQRQRRRFLRTSWRSR